MDLEDLFKAKYHKHGHHHEDSHHHGGHYKIQWLLFAVKALRKNKALLAAFIIGLLLVLAACIVLLALFLPMLGKAAGFVSQNGILGFLNSIPDVAQQILHGKG